jgi:hypothetical protein
VFWLCVLAAMAGIPVVDRYTETPAQTQARTFRLAVDRDVCRHIATCAAYGRARQACATAGSFDTCMSVKLGTVPLTCTDEGKLHWPPAELPDAVRCWWVETF